MGEEKVLPLQRHRGTLKRILTMEIITEDQKAFLRKNAPHLLAPPVLDGEHLDYLDRHLELLIVQVYKFKAEIAKARKYKDASQEEDILSDMREIVNEIGGIHDCLDNDLGDEE